MVPSVRPGIEVTMTREPVGVVGIITPWNFPIAIPAWKIAPALCYGNTVVFKPADLVPGSAWAIVDILARAGLPKGVLNLVMGKGSVVGDAIINSPDVNAITFTGSVSTGRKVADASVKLMRKFQLEMGGKNPLVVLDDADLKVAVEAPANGAYFSTGQRCTASSRLVVTDGIHDKFVDALTERLKGLVVDDAFKEGTHIGPVVDPSQLKQDEDYINIGRKEGAKLRWGGERLNRETPGFYLQPALFTDTKPEMRSTARRSSGRWRASSGSRTTTRRSRRQRHALRAVLGHLHDQPEIRHALQAQLRGRHGDGQPADRRRRLSRAVRRAEGSSYGPREQGRYAAEFFTTVKTAYTLP